VIAVALALVNALEQGSAWLIENGQGICNTIYVDNLVEAIRCSLEAPQQASGSAYLVGDEETVTWRTLYQFTAKALDIDFESIAQIPLPTAPQRTLSDRLNGARVLPLTQRLIAAVPSSFKRVLKGAASGLMAQPMLNPWKVETEGVSIHPSREMVLLQQCRYKFPCMRATTDLGYQPVVEFEEGLQRTLSWIEWSRTSH
jgi:nucleoside-diphosphate-sugar epimerase